MCFSLDTFVHIPYTAGKPNGNGMDAIVTLLGHEYNVRYDLIDGDSSVGVKPGIAVLSVMPRKECVPSGWEERWMDLYIRIFHDEITDQINEVL